MGEFPRLDPAFNRDRRTALRLGVPFSTVLNPIGQPIDDAVPISSLIQVFQDRDIPIVFDPTKAKLPLRRNGVLVPTKSSIRYDSYSSATTTKQYFEQHCGTAGEARRDFYHDLRHQVFTITDGTHAKMHFLFAHNLPVVDTFTGNNEFVNLLTEGMESTQIALHQAMVLQSVGTSEHYFVLDDLLTRIASQNQFDNIRLGLRDDGEPLRPYSDSDYAFRVEEMTDYLRLYANYGWTTDSDSPDNALPVGRVEDIALMLVTNDNHKVEILPEKIASLRGYEGAARERMIRAIAKELVDMIYISTFERLPLPRVGREVPTTLVLKVKHRADGSWEKDKARLVVQGFRQVVGRDFHATFSPMASFVNVRILLSLACTNGWRVMHGDIPQAFLRSRIDSDMYVSLAKGVQLIDKATGLPYNHNGDALKLRRALYGCRQSPQLFNKVVNQFFVEELGWVRGENESCLYHHFDPVTGDIAIALLEVDDVLMTSNSDAVIEKFYTMLNAKFGVGHSIPWEPVSSFMGVNVVYDRSARELTLDVAAKISTLFADHSLLRMLPTKATPIPGGDGSKRLCADAAILTHLRSHYSSIVGALIYMSISCRPDLRLKLSYGIGRLSRHMHKPTDDALGYKL